MHGPHPPYARVYLSPLQYIDNSSDCPEGGITAVFGSIEFNAAFIRKCVINAAFEFIQQYDVYR